MKVGNLHRPSFNRRQFLAGACALTALTTWGLSADKARKPTNGTLSLCEAFDQEMERFMSARMVPGAALAVVKDRRLVYARGYGGADREKQEKVSPESLFRIASISKPFTAVAALKLTQAGRLDLDRSVVGLVGIEPSVREHKQIDKRLKQVTVRHCLHHTGGWDRNVSGDPMFRSVEIARATGVAPPASQNDIIAYMLGQPLDFDPGTRYAYSNFGYCLLGRVIEKVAETKYSDFV